jgi:hypothetical protein
VGWIDLPTGWVLQAMTNQKSLTHYEATQRFICWWDELGTITIVSRWAATWGSGQLLILNPLHSFSA